MLLSDPVGGFQEPRVSEGLFVLIFFSIMFWDDGRRGIGRGEGKVSVMAVWCQVYLSCGH